MLIFPFLNQEWSVPDAVAGRKFFCATTVWLLIKNNAIPKIFTVVVIDIVKIVLVEIDIQSYPNPATISIYLYQNTLVQHDV